MRASTLTAILVSVVLGLGAVIAARALGLFGQVQSASPPMLVASRNILAGTLVSANDVNVRAMTTAEFSEFVGHSDDYLPAIPQAVSQRVTSRIIEANRPIRRSDFEPLDVPEPLRARLAPGTRSVNVAVSKARSSGGVIQPGDWVDVSLTTTVVSPNGSDQTRTARIVAGVRVILKRNSLYPIFAPLPDDEDIDFTLEAEPFNAALIEHAKTKGPLSLVVLNERERGRLEVARIKALAGRAADPAGGGATDQARRAASFQDGQDSIGDEDLAKLFALAPPKPAATPAVIQRYTAGKREADVVFPSKAAASVTAADLDGSTGFRFEKPPVTDEDKAAAKSRRETRSRNLASATPVAGQSSLTPLSSLPGARPSR